jgi:hypothetical protein
MSNDLWHATLNPSSPRYLSWRKIFPSDDIPIRSPIPVKAKLDGDPEEIYLLDWIEMGDYESEKLIAFVVEKFQTTRAIAVAQLDSDEFFPIRKADVLVSFSMRAFL